MTAARDYSDLHALIERLEPGQAEELREHALRLVKPAGGRFRVLRPFDGQQTALPPRARQRWRRDNIPRAEQLYLDYTADDEE